jgi:hypothetical protein
MRLVENKKHEESEERINGRKMLVHEIIKTSHCQKFGTQIGFNLEPFCE